MLTQAELKEWLHYDPGTGIFTRIAAYNNAFQVGDIAGSVNDRGYVYIGVLGKAYKAHRLAFLYMTGEWPDDQVDHKDGDKTNNSWRNLRKATYSQNLANRPALVTNKLGIKGVYKRSKRYTAKIYTNGKSIHIGTFDTAEEANSAYFKAAQTLHGKFARG